MIVQNPLMNVDMPDPDLLRIGDTWYMISTTMFYMPGAPILKSGDLCHWEIVSYVFDRIEDNEIYRLENGKHAYGKGQWATSLTKYKDRFYACFVCHDMGKTYIYSTDDGDVRIRRAPNMWLGYESDYGNNFIVRDY